MLHSKRLMKRLPHVVHTKGSLGTNEKRLHMLAAVVQQVGLPSLHPAARECVQQGIVMHNSDLKILSESLGALQPTLLFSWLRDVPRSTATPPGIAYARAAHPAGCASVSHCRPVHAWRRSDVRGTGCKAIASCRVVESFELAELLAFHARYRPS